MILSSFPLIFCLFCSVSDGKSCVSVDQQTAFRAPVCWSKYTTNAYPARIVSPENHISSLISHEFNFLRILFNRYHSHVCPIRMDFIHLINCNNHFKYNLNLNHYSLHMTLGPIRVTSFVNFPFLSIQVH